MSEGLLEAMGGLGLFLMGMFVMTDALKELAGRSLRTALRRFTRSPASGAATGAVATAIIQSSSATTVTAVGFVGAGLMTFAQALGIIFGANIGTTITGWFVALFGFKVPLGTLAFPLVLVGALLRVFGRSRWASFGKALAGFGLVFVGIELLQDGLAGLEGDVTPDSFPPNTWLGRLQLVGIGVLITLVTQSSSAGVALALAAVDAGTITFPQAAAIVIGMDIGTTVTAAMAAAGGGTQVKRTGLAHVVYNLMTGVGAFFLLPLYVEIVERSSPDLLTDQPEILLVAFHTLFNGLGVIAVLPFTSRFAALIERIVPEPEDDATHALGRSLLSDPDAALDVVEESLRRLSRQTLGTFVRLWHQGRVRTGDLEELEDMDRAVARVKEYVAEIQSGADQSQRLRHEAAMHTVDHLGRLLQRLDRPGRVRTAANDTALHARGGPLIDVTEQVVAWLEGEGSPATDRAEEVTDDLIAQVRPYRTDIIRRSTTEEVDPELLEARIDAIRWLARVANHVWRVSLYLEQLAEPVADLAVADTEPDV